MIYVILAMDEKNGIGKNNTIPWHSTADFRHFKQTTIGSIILMGANTWRSLPTKPLPNRTNVVVSSHPIDGVLTVHPTAIERYLLSTKLMNESDVYIIGGAMLVNSSLYLCDELIITHIPGDHQCDVSLPNIFDDFFEYGMKTLSDGLIVKQYKHTSENA